MPSSTALLLPALAADARGSYDAGVSKATADDLALIEAEAGTFEASRRRIVLALAASPTAGTGRQPSGCRCVSTSRS